MMFLLVALSVMVMGEAQAEQRRPQKGCAPVKVKVDIGLNKGGCPSMHGKPYCGVCDRYSKPPKRGCGKHHHKPYGKGYGYGKPMKGCPVCADRFNPKGRPGHHPEFRPDGRPDGYPNGRPNGNHNGRPNGNHYGRK